MMKPTAFSLDNVLVLQDVTIYNILEQISGLLSVLPRAGTKHPVFKHPLSDFLARVVYAVKMDVISLLTTWVYVERMRQCAPSKLELQRRGEDSVWADVFRMGLTCLMLGAKYTEDVPFNNAAFVAAALGYRKADFERDVDGALNTYIQTNTLFNSGDINRCELELLMDVQFNLYVSPSMLMARAGQLIATTAARRAFKSEPVSPTRKKTATSLLKSIVRDGDEQRVPVMPVFNRKSRIRRMALQSIAGIKEAAAMDDGCDELIVVV